MSIIVQKDDQVLRLTAKPVPLESITFPEIQKLLREMSQALAAEADGVALAAPQVGKSWRIFIVSGKIIDEEKPPADLVFINPKIKKASRVKAEMEEGCLSVRWIYGHVKRATRVTVEAYDESGKKFTHHGSGLLAQIFQHEMDHLDGTLFIDKADNLQEIKPEDIQ
jgi:peptide deformylase